jgi:DNA-binding NarL/FixJ family response regulator
MSHASKTANVLVLMHTTPEVRKRLPERDILILRGLREGLTDREIAETLGLSEKTVHYHMRLLIARLDARNRTHAVIQAIRKNWIGLDG